VVGADQVLWDGHEVIGKPADAADHLRRLRGFRGRSHTLLTGWHVVGPGGVHRSGVERTVLWVRGDLSDAELAAYVATGEGTGCAGGYAVEGHGAWLFERIDGDWFNVVGLPLLAVLTALRELGWRYDGGARG
jgi:septum formation protein